MEVFEKPMSSPVDPEDVVQHLIEQHQWNVQLFFIEDLQTGLDIVPQLFLFHWDVVLHHKQEIQQKWKIKC